MTAVAEMVDELKSSVKFKGNKLLYMRALNYEGRYYYDMALANPDLASEFMEKARNCCDEAEKLAKSVPDGMNRFLMDDNVSYLILQYAGEYERAAKRLEEIISVPSCNISTLSNAYVMLVESYRFLRRHDEALKWANKALEFANGLEISRFALSAYAVLANLHYDMEEHEKSIEACNHQLAAYACLEDAENKKNHSARLWSHMGHCYRELGKLDKAEIYFEACIGSGVVSNSVTSAYLGFGEVCCARGDYNKGKDMLLKAEEMFVKMPSNAWVDSVRCRIEELKSEYNLDNIN